MHPLHRWHLAWKQLVEAIDAIFYAKLSYPQICQNNTGAVEHKVGEAQLKCFNEVA